jgi:hypothetical protein
MLGGGRSNISNFKIKVTDLVTVQFNNKFDVKGAQIYDKNNNTIELPAGSGYLISTHYGINDKGMERF